MAIGNVNFLKMSAMKKTGAVNPQQGGNNTNAIQAQRQDDSKAGKAQEPNMVDMSTSELIKNMYGNKVEIQDKTNGEQKAMKLPRTVEYGNEKFPAMGKQQDEVIDMICKKTGDSKMKVESELKRKYANPAGTSLNMQA